MKVKGLILVVIATACFTDLAAQKLSMGTLPSLRDAKKLNAVFDCSAMFFLSNPEAVAFALKGEVNEKRDEGANKWEEAKATMHPEHFSGHVNEYLNARNILSPASASCYTAQTSKYPRPQR
jgi:hypothetical protein